MTAPRSRRGVVLLVVLFFALLLASTITTFLRRSTVDSIVSHNRDDAARAEALARGGVRLAEALLIEDRLTEQAKGARSDSSLDAWANPAVLSFDNDDHSSLRVTVEDSGARLNLNALFQAQEPGKLIPGGSTEPFLIALLDKVIGEMDVSPEVKAGYDRHELADNLIDWVDADDVRVRGGPEDDFYQRQDPPYRAANGPLLSVDDLRLVEGFDDRLVTALTPYVTVYPFVAGGCVDAGKGCGVNLNTAPPHVLALLFYNDGVQDRLATEDVVRQILKAREQGGTICVGAATDETCTPLNDIIVNPVFPPPTVSSDIFFVTAEGRVGDVRRSVDAVVDRSDPALPRLLSWRVH
jgi:general secretion pathway protein K